MKKVRLGVLISGSGTTLQNFIDCIKAGTLNAQIACVVSSSEKAYGLVRARENNIPSITISRKKYETVEEFSKAIFSYLESFSVDLVTLAGYLKLIKVPDEWLGKVMNIHPALIPLFCGEGWYGMKVHNAVVESGVKVTGCTVHFVDNVYDHGPVIVQKVVSVLDTDTAEDVQKRVFEQEKIAYPEAINLFAAGRLKIAGRRVHIVPKGSVIRGKNA
jgi:formyltetrahydrofolate-dependent phosphoribosylglycinamide formyltransferase